MEYYIYISKNCNLSCSYCSSPIHQRNIEDHEIPPDVRQVSKFISLQSKNGVEIENIVFYGGEPLLSQEWIKEFIKIFGNKNTTSFTLQTNGILLDKIDQFILDNLDFLHLSIDGNEETTDKNRGKGTYKKILNNFLTIKNKFKGKTLARMVATEDNPIDDSVLHLLNHFNFVYWQFQGKDVRFSINKIKKDYEKRLDNLVFYWFNKIQQGEIKDIVPFTVIINSLLNKKNYNDYRCGAGTQLITIDIDGSCYSCDFLLKPEFKIGSIYDNKIVKPKKLISKIYEKYCIPCEVKGICGGRCYCDSLVYEENVFREYCDLTKMLIKKLEKTLPKIEDLISKDIIKKEDFNRRIYTEEIP